MNSPKAQSDPSPTASYFDADAADNSEQQFSASLEAPAERPQFVVDAPEGREKLDLVVQDRRSSTEVAQPDNAIPLSSQKAQSGALSEAVHPERVGAEAPSSEQSGFTGEQDWRRQVSAKIGSYKSRKPQKPRYPSLQLQFEPIAYKGRVQSEALSPVDTDFDQPFADQRVASPPPFRQTEPPVSTEATARVLEFPRSVATVRGDELADPVIDRPRIVEAPELLPPPPALGGILIEPIHEPEPERRPGFDLPLQSTPLSRRILAGGIDALMVAVALAAFGYTFFRINGAAPQGRSTLSELLAALLVIFWPAYQYAFLIFTGTTPGLRLAKLQVSRFDGTLAPRNLRRWRVLASLLSCISLGLGYAWCFLDEDRLSWHDRITKTHLAPKFQR
jgi:uncharacterized RDD family membrane protein YckC